MTALSPCTCGPNGNCPADCPQRARTRPVNDRVLGLDPGKTTGWCVYYGPEFPAAFGCHDLKGDDLGAQLTDFKHWLEDMLADHRPGILALERPFGRAAFTSDLPGTLCGVAHMVAHCQRTARREFSASGLKKAITGAGRAPKGAVVAAVRDKFRIPVLTSHEADAAGVAIMAWNQAAQERTEA